MKDIDIYNIQVSDIELFLNVAQYGSFTKAGEKMFMSQPWVSKRIDMLERELDMNLFIRKKRSIELTPAGRVLAQRFEGLTDLLLDAIREAQVAQAGASGFMRVGFLDWGDIEFLGQIKSFLKRHPQFDVDVSQMNFKELRTALSEERVDVIFTVSYDCGEFENEAYEIIPVRTVPLMAYMSYDNPLSCRAELAMQDLRGELMLMVDQKSSPGYSTYIQELFSRYSFNPRVAHYAHSGGEHIGNLLIGKGILLASRSFLDNTLVSQIARVPVTGESVQICAVSTRKANPVLDLFLQEVLGA